MRDLVPPVRGIGFSGTQKGISGRVDVGLVHRTTIKSFPSLSLSLSIDLLANSLLSQVFIVYISYLRNYVPFVLPFIASVRIYCLASLLFY